MYAIVEIAGHQFKVEKDQKVFVNRLQTEEGRQVTFDNVLLLADGDKVTIGAPAIDGAQVGAKVLKHLKGDKVIVFKKKRRKGYRVKNGHRQSLTEIKLKALLLQELKKLTSESCSPKANQQQRKKFLNQLLKLLSKSRSCSRFDLNDCCTIKRISKS